MTLKIPKILTEINLDALKEICQEYLSWIDSSEYSEDGNSDYDTYITEIALMTVFGDNVYKDFIVPRCREHENE